MTRTLEQCAEASTASESPALWRARLRRRWALQALKDSASVLCHASFILMLLPLPLKVVVWLMGVWRFFAWWHVPLCIVAGYLLGEVADHIERWVLAGFIRREFSPPSGTPPGAFPAHDIVLECPCCHARLTERAPVSGFLACRCGALVCVRDGAVELVAAEPDSPG